MSAGARGDRAPGKIALYRTINITERICRPMNKNVDVDTHKTSIAPDASHKSPPSVSRRPHDPRRPDRITGRGTPTSEGGPPPPGALDVMDVEAGPKRLGGDRTRGGSSYQHSLSARGITSSGRARSHSSEDLLTSIERLEHAARFLATTDDERVGRHAYGHDAAGKGSPPHEKPGGRQDRQLTRSRFNW